MTNLHIASLILALISSKCLGELIGVAYFTRIEGARPTWTNFIEANSIWHILVPIVSSICLMIAALIAPIGIDIYIYIMCSS